MKSVYEPASRAESLTIGHDGECLVHFTGFEERDVETDEITFSWSPRGHIALNESYWFPINHTAGNFEVDKMCKNGLGYM